MLLKWTGSEYPSLKIALRGKFELGSDPYLFQRIKLGRCAKFHAGIMICMINVIRAPTKRPARITYQKKKITVTLFARLKFPGLKTYITALKLDRKCKNQYYNKG